MTTQERILHELGKISGQVEALHGHLKGHALQAQAYNEKTDKRLTNLEQAKWKLAGAVAASVFAAELFWRLAP